jgi:hypothetical protein
MMRRFARTVVALALLATTLLACSDEEVVQGAPPSPSPTPSPSVPTQPSMVRYVSTTGSDKNPGTLDQPWRTLAHALHTVYDGQVLFVRGGTYREQIDHLRLHTGTRDAPITVLAYPGENPVLVGTISLRRPAFWLIDNLDVQGDPSVPARSSFMVKVIGGRGWTWENSDFSDTTGKANVLITGFGIGEPSAFRFSGNCLRGLPSLPLGSTNLFLGAMLKGAHGIVERNVVFNTEGQPNVRVGSGAGAPRRVKIRENTIFGGSLAIDVRGHPHGVTISKNIVGGSITAPAMIRFHRGKPHGTKVTSNVAVVAKQMFRPEVRKIVNGFGNAVLSQDPKFVDTTRCDGYRPGLDALIPYGAFAP